MTHQTSAAHEAMAAELVASGNYRVLRRFQPLQHYGAPDASAIARGVLIDVETTGLDRQHDAVIELAVLPFEYARASGRVGRVHECLVYREDPGRPIPPEVVRLTGITDAQVAGQKIDDAAVLHALQSVDLVIAHNAAFDRVFLERRLPRFADLPWACSVNDVPWKALGYASASLEFLMFQMCNVFYQPHAAESDCRAVLHLLCQEPAAGPGLFAQLLHAAARATVRVAATDAAFATKELLKARGYRWHQSPDGRTKAWTRELPEDAVADECEWLRITIYGGASGRWTLEAVDATTRYTDRQR